MIQSTIVPRFFRLDHGMEIDIFERYDENWNYVFNSFINYQQYFLIHCSDSKMIGGICCFLNKHTEFFSF